MLDCGDNRQGRYLVRGCLIECAKGCSWVGRLVSGCALGTETESHVHALGKNRTWDIPSPSSRSMMLQTSVRILPL